jgi:hypothetical protein
MAARRGVYFLANDSVLDMTIGFLASFRACNPTIPLCLIPFADDVAELTALASRFEFSVWDDVDALDRCDEISRRFHGHTVGQYRKLVMWQGPYDEFIYIDTDTIVLNSVDFVYSHLDSFEFVTTHSDMADIRRFVWKDSIYGTGALSDGQIGYAANTGFVASRREAISADHLAARLPDAVALAAHMELDCVEQPLLNYLIVTSGHRYSSLFAIAMATGRWDIPTELWGGHPEIEVHDGRVTHPSHPILLVHWAGEWSQARRENRPIPHHELYDFYRRTLSPAGSRT